MAPVERFSEFRGRGGAAGVGAAALEQNSIAFSRKDVVVSSKWAVCAALGVRGTHSAAIASAT